MTFFYQRTLLKYLFGFILFIQVTFSSAGTSYVWNRTVAGTYNWNDASNWLPSTGYPGSGGSTTDNAVLSSTTVTQTITFPTGTLTLNSITCTGAASHILILNMTSCDLVVSGTMAEWVYTTLNSANSITVTASDHIKTDHATFDNFPVTLTCTNISKSGGSVASNQALYINSSTFASAFTSSSKTYLFTSNTFSGITSIEKKDFGSTTVSSSTGNAGNVFNNQASFICNDNAANSGIYWGQAVSSTQDAFNGVTTFTNNSLNSFLINTVSGTVNFTNHAYFYNTSSGSISLANTSSCVVNFTGTSSSTINVFCSNTGTGGIYMSISGAVNFDYANVVFGSTNGGTTRIASMAVSTAVNTLKATSTLNVYPDASSVPSTIPANPYFSNGTFSIDRLVIENSVAGTTLPDVSLNLGTSATLDLRTGISLGQYRSLIAKAPNYTGIGGTYNGTASFTCNSTTANRATYTYNQLTFNRDVSFICQSAYYWTIGGYSGSTLSGSNVYFNSTPSFSRSVVKVQNLGTGVIYFGGFTACTFNFSNVILNLVRIPDATHTADAGAIQLCYNVDIKLDATSTLKIDQTFGGGILLGNAAGGIAPVNKTPYTGAACRIAGNWDTSNFRKGTINLGFFIGVGDTQIITPIDADYKTSVGIYNNAVFQGNLEIQCQNINGYGGWYQKNTIFHRHGSGNGSTGFDGYPEFDGNFTAINESSPPLVTTDPVTGVVTTTPTVGSIYFGSTSSDIFTYNGNVLIQYVTVGSTVPSEIKLSRFGLSYYRGNLRYEGEFGTVPFGLTSGKSIFDGPLVVTNTPADDQTISSTTTTTPFSFTFLEVNKAHGKLILATNVALVKYSTTVPVLTLRNGIIVSNSDISKGPLTTFTLSDDASVIGGSKNSFVDGPFTKIGNDAFKFYVGKGVKYFPLSITAPSSTGSVFTTEFFDTTQPNGTSMTGTLQDAINCQYWKVDKTGTASSAISMTLFWNNDTLQSCYPINHNLVCVAHYNGSNWVNEGSVIVNDYQPADSGYVSSTTSPAGLTTFGYFALGYKNALVLNTIGANPSLFKVLSHTEPFYHGFTSGPLGTAAGTKTLLSVPNNVAGKVVIHPDFSQQVDVTIDQATSNTPHTDARAIALTYESLNLKLYTNASGSTPACTLVTANEDGVTFNPLSDQYYGKSGNNLNFYKQRQEDNVYVLANSLTDGITFPVSTTGTTTPFQITNVPSGATAVLSVYNLSSGTSIYSTITNPLSWDGKVSGVNVVEGVYRYTLVLTVASTPYTYNGQLVVKYQ